MTGNLDLPFALDHIGIAVSSIEEGRKFYEAMGFRESATEEVPSEKVRVVMFELANSSRLELLEPLDETSPIAKFLEKRKPGIHHICLRVDDIHSVLQDLKEKNVRLIDEHPKPGAHNCQVAFVHPSATGGVLLELSQPPENEKGTP